PCHADHRALSAFPTRRSSDLVLRPLSARIALTVLFIVAVLVAFGPALAPADPLAQDTAQLLQGPSTAHPLGTDALGRDVLSRLRSEEHTSELQSRENLVCRLL